MEALSACALRFLEKIYRVRFQTTDELSARHRTILNGLVEGRHKYFVFSPSLGWTIKRYGNVGLYRANSAGMRGRREYALNPPPDRIRVAAFGDSFTHCDTVGDHQTWPALMERADPRLEVVNFGVSAYGLDQAYLRYLETGRKYRPRVVLIGYMTENIYRHVNVFRPYYSTSTGFPLAKPRFDLTDAGLQLLPNPVQSLDDYRRLLTPAARLPPSFWARDHYCSFLFPSNALDLSRTVRLTKMVVGRLHRKLSRGIVAGGIYDQRGDAFKITTGIIDRFYSRVQRERSTPIVLVFPDKREIHDHHMGREVRYRPLIDYLVRKKYRHMDLAAAFDGPDARGDLAAHFNGTHYSARGTRLIADLLITNIHKDVIKRRPRSDAMPQN